MLDPKYEQEELKRRPLNTKYAIISGKIATIHKGKRIIQTYKSGEKLKGRIEN